MSNEAALNQSIPGADPVPVRIFRRGDGSVGFITDPLGAITVTDAVEVVPIMVAPGDLAGIRDRVWSGTQTFAEAVTAYGQDDGDDREIMGADQSMTNKSPVDSQNDGLQGTEDARS
jgi:hypothetical protein